MTRKDYINIAAAILATQTRIRNRAGDPHEAELQLRGVRRTAAHLCDFLAADNPKGFNPTLFLVNCGYGPTTMNPRNPALDLRPLPDEERENIVRSMPYAESLRRD